MNADRMVCDFLRIKTQGSISHMRDRIADEAIKLPLTDRQKVMDRFNLIEMILTIHAENLKNAESPHVAMSDTIHAIIHALGSSVPLVCGLDIDLAKTLSPLIGQGILDTITKMEKELPSTSAAA